jgi:hypothetical protein
MPGPVRYSLHSLAVYLHPQLPHVKSPDPLRDTHSSHAHEEGHKQIHAIVVQPVATGLEASTLVALIMRTATLGSYRGAGSTASSQGGRIGNGLRITQMRAARYFG